MFGRIFLFVATNILVILTVSALMWIFGVESYLGLHGELNYSNLMIFCLLWGFTGSFISLSISRWTAKSLLKIKLIKEDAFEEYQWLGAMVARLSKAAGLPKTPQVGIYVSDDVNAFATGPSKSRSLVAFSTAILQKMTREEIEGVAAHEVSHIKNGDMVTMTLLQGVINAFIMFFARIVAFAVSNAVREEFANIVWFVTVILFEIIFGALGLLVTSWFSRKREFRADAGSAQLAGRDNMIKALQALQNIKQQSNPPKAVAALAISGKKGSGIFRVFATHPPLEERIAELQKH